MKVLGINPALARCAQAFHDRAVHLPVPGIGDVQIRTSPKNPKLKCGRLSVMDLAGVRWYLPRMDLVVRLYRPSINFLSEAPCST